MNPLSLKATAIVGVVAAGLAFSAAWKVQSWRWDASLKDAAEAAQVAQEKAVAVHAAKQKAWEAKEAELTVARDTAQTELATLRQNPVRSIVYRDKVMPDGTICADPRIPLEWWMQFNATALAADGASASEANR